MIVRQGNKFINGSLHIDRRTEFSRVLKEQTGFIMKYKRGSFQEGVFRAKNVQDLYSTEELVYKLKNSYETTVGGVV